ncbi:MAG: DUF2157 domain-containing protein, partial [Selenomonadales bacterium]|nr:DUF2157 domain-containing protein [Selenomonadales bacterium]
LVMKTDCLARFREAASLLQSAAVGISLILAAQTYDLGADPAWLFGAWMVLILPIALLMETVLPVFAYAALFFVWLLQAYDVSYIWFSWLLLLPLVPFQRRLEMDDARGCRVLAWLMVFGFAATFVACFHNWFGDYSVQIMAIFFYCLSAMGVRLDRTDEFWNKPLFSLGLTGALFCMYLLTFYNLWHRSTEVIFTPSFFLLLGVGAIGSFFVWQHSEAAKRDGLLRFSAMMVPIVGIVSVLWIVGMPDWIAVSVINIYLFIIGICLAVRGLRGRQISVFNIGMLLTAALIIARFFDIEADLMVRGTLYGILGLLFLGGNCLIMKKKGGTAPHEDTDLQQMEGKTTDGADGYDLESERNEYDFDQLVRTIRETQESLHDEDIPQFGKHTTAEQSDDTAAERPDYARFAESAQRAIADGRDELSAQRTAADERVDDSAQRTAADERNDAQDETAADEKPAPKQAPAQ